MNPADIRAFVLRDRAEVEGEKRAYWARRHGESAHLAAFDVSGALYEHARRVRPGFPLERERADDLAHHVVLKQLLDEASCALAVR